MIIELEDFARFCGTVMGLIMSGHRVTRICTQYEPKLVFRAWYEPWTQDTVGPRIEFTIGPIITRPDAAA